jgi:WD40 repeat protein
LIAQHYYDGTGNWFAIWRTSDGKLINTFEALHMQISTDNQLVAAQRGIQDVPGQESKYHVFLYNLQTGEQLGDWVGESPTFLSDNSLVMESDGYLYIFDPQNHDMRHRFAGKFAAFSPDEQIVAILSDDAINLYNVTDGKLLRKLKVDLSRISKRSPYGFLFSPDGQRILVHNQVLRIADGSLVADIPPTFISSITNLAFTPDGQQIIVASYDNLYLYPVASKDIWIPEAGDPETYLPILNAASPRSVYLGLSFEDLPLEEIHSPDGKFLAKNNQGIVTIWNTSGEGGSFTVPAEPETVALTYPTNGQRVTRIAFSSDGHLAAFGLRAGSVELWNLESQQKVFTIPPLVDTFNFVGGLSFSPDGKLLAIGSEDGVVRLYEINAK